MPHLSLDDLTAQSEMVVSGTVARSWADWDSEHRFIWTHYEVAISETWKGRANRIVIVSEPGGVLNGMGMNIPGSTPYKVGERVNVFLYRTPIGYMRTTNYGQGKFPVGASQSEFRTQVRQTIEKQKGNQIR
jgi:hypothetical protein